VKVSIIIRNWNYGCFLRDAIDSALAQTHVSTEVIVLDDGSTDDSREILALYGNQVRAVLRAENGGEGSAVNAGFAAATGDIVLFLDSDDVLAPEAVARIVALWDMNVARIHFPLCAMDADGTLLPRVHPPFEVPDIPLEEQLGRFGQVISGSQSCNAYASWALRRILPIDEAVWYRACDCYLNALTMAQGSTRLIHEPMGGYRFHAANLSLRNSLDVGLRERAVLFHPNIYRAVRSFVGEERWKSYRPKPPCYHWIHRFLSFRLNPSHPFAGDRFIPLMMSCVESVCMKPLSSMSRRLFLLAGLGVAGVLPRALLRRLLPRMLIIARSTALPRVRRRDPARHWRRVYGVDAVTASE
jgi:glycosyltransferase involved in cell wall biosynthesis